VYFNPDRIQLEKGPIGINWYEIGNPIILVSNGLPIRFFFARGRARGNDMLFSTMFVH
jgi:hypothetical protein